MNKNIAKKNLVKGVAGAAVMASLIAVMGVTARASDYSADGTHSMTVTATVDSSYTVQLPATLELQADSADSLKYTGTYEYGVKGALPNSKGVKITSTGDWDSTKYFSKFTMSGADGNSATAYYRLTNETKGANNTQDVIFANAGNTHGYTAINGGAFTTKTGKVEVTFPAADTYTGTAGFTFALDNIAP